MKALVSLLLLAAAFVAQAADFPLPAGVTRVTSVEGITEYNLANGLRILLAPDESKPTTTVNTTFLVGSRHENYGETGMAHLLEHLYFKGTPTYPLVWQEYTKRGMRANGSTWTDRTNYFASFAANDENLHWYLRWSADAMTNSFIARKDLDSEMTVVRNEMELGENNPVRALLQQATAAAFSWHSYGKSTIGARADVENVNIERLQAFYRNYYQPDNAVLIVTGKFDEPRTLALIAAEFGKIPRPARKLQPTYTLDPAQQGERSVTLRRTGEAQFAIAVYHIPAGPSPDYTALNLAASILGDVPSGRLHKALVETKKAASVFGQSYAFREPGLAVFGAQVAKDASLDAAKEALVATIEGVAAAPITAEELERARIKYLRNFDLTASDPEKVGVALSSAIAQGDWRLIFIERDRVRAAKVEDVQRAAAAYLLQDNRTMGSFIPTAEPRRPPAPALVDVAPMVKDYKGDTAIAQGEAFDPSPENIDRRTERLRLGNGMKVALLTKRTRGATVNAQLVLHLGDEKSLFGTGSIGAMTGSMVSRGADGLTRTQIQDTFDRLKARVSIGGGPTVARVSIETTRANLPEVLKLVARVLRKPDFPATELEILRGELLAGIDAQRKEPDVIARLAISRHGDPYPRGDVRHERDFDEAAADVKAVKLDDVRRFHAEFYGADHAQFAAVGDFDLPAIRALLEELFGGWKSARPYQRVPAPYVAIPAAELKFETPDKANAFFVSRLNFPMRDDDAEYAAYLIANQIIGGGTGGMLFKRIREKEGISYGVGSGVSVSSHEPHAVWTANAIYAPENLPRLLSTFREEINRAWRDGFTEQELKDAKNGLLQARSLSRAQDPTVAGVLANYLELDRTMAFSGAIDRAIADATLAQVNAAFRKYFDPAKLVTVYAGDFAKPAK
jgi:zinc protease